MQPGNRRKRPLGETIVVVVVTVSETGSWNSLGSPG